MLKSCFVSLVYYLVGTLQVVQVCAPDQAVRRHLTQLLHPGVLARVVRGNRHVHDLRVELLIAAPVPVRQHRVALVDSGVLTLFAAGKKYIN